MSQINKPTLSVWETGWQADGQTDALTDRARRLPWCAGGESRQWGRARDWWERSARRPLGPESPAVVTSAPRSPAAYTSPSGSPRTWKPRHKTYSLVVFLPPAPQTPIPSLLKLVQCLVVPPPLPPESPYLLARWNMPYWPCSRRIKKPRHNVKRISCLVVHPPFPLPPSPVATCRTNIVVPETEGHVTNYYNVLWSSKFPRPQNLKTCLTLQSQHLKATLKTYHVLLFPQA